MSTLCFVVLSTMLASGEPAANTVVEVLDKESGFAVAPFELEDQFRETTSYAPPKGVAHVVFIADRHSGYDTVKWYLRFEEEFGDALGYYGIGALEDIPRFFRPMVRPFLRRQIDKPILLDWDNTVSESLRYEAGVPNVLLVAADGTVLAHIVGKMEDGAYQKSCNILAPHVEDRGEVPPMALRQESDTEPKSENVP